MLLVQPKLLCLCGEKWWQAWISLLCPLLITDLCQILSLSSSIWFDCTSVCSHWFQGICRHSESESKWGRWWVDSKNPLSDFLANEPTQKLIKGGELQYSLIYDPHKGCNRMCPVKNPSLWWKHIFTKVSKISL